MSFVLGMVVGIVLGLAGSFFIWKNNRNVMDEALGAYNDVVAKLEELKKKLEALETLLGKKDGK